MISRIDGSGPIRTPSPVRRTSKTSGTGGTSFSEHLDETGEAEGASGTQGTGALGSVAGVLNIQEVDDALARAAKGKLRAEDILERLDDLRLDLLSGSLSRTKLQQLSDVVQSRRSEVNDPKLTEILDEIDLRAQVELAKFTPS